MSRIWPSLIGVWALAMPIAPEASARVMVLQMCGGNGVSVSIPLGDGAPGDGHGCCRDQGCHAAHERKRAKGRTG